MNAEILEPAAGALPEDPDRAGGRTTRPFPTATGVRILAFVGLACAEYWILPVVVPIGNWVGPWSTLGYLLLGAATVALVVWIVMPVAARLRPAFGLRGARARWAAIFAGVVLGALILTRSVQFGSVGPENGTVAAIGAVGDVATPFGILPGWTLSVPAIGLTGSIDPVSLGTYGVVGFLVASLVVLRRSSRWCDPKPRPGTNRWATLLAGWGPLGLVSACPGCSPAYLAVLSSLAPGAFPSLFASIPLTPWVGLAGLVDLASIGCLIALFRNAIARTEPRASPDPRSESSE